MTDDKKTDRVISMADFKKSAKNPNEGTSSVMSPEEVLEFMKTYELGTVVVLGQHKDGSFRFGGNIADISEVVFLLEVYRKIILDAAVGFGEQ